MGNSEFNLSDFFVNHVKSSRQIYLYWVGGYIQTAFLTKKSLPTLNMTVFELSTIVNLYHLLYREGLSLYIIKVHIHFIMF